MFVREELRAELARHGMSEDDLAELLGISRNTLYARYKACGDFSRSEIEKIGRRFGFDCIMRIFFAE